MGTYDNQRVNFDLVAKKYKDYLALYYQLSGSLDGITTFDEFYIRIGYLYRYADPTKVGTPGF